MKEQELKIQVLDKELYPNGAPEYACYGDAGFDLRATQELIIPPYSRAIVGCGLKMEIPLGYELQIRPRSGLAIKIGLTVLNSPGTIDSGFRDEIGIILFNTTNEPIYIPYKERIAQGVLKEFVTAKFTVVKEVSNENNRGGGLGHSGSI